MARVKFFWKQWRRGGGWERERESSKTSRLIFSLISQLLWALPGNFLFRLLIFITSSKPLWQIIFQRLKLLFPLRRPIYCFKWMINRDKVSTIMLKNTVFDLSSWSRWADSLFSPVMLLLLPWTREISTNRCICDEFTTCGVWRWVEFGAVYALYWITVPPLIVFTLTGFDGGLRVY